MCIFLVFFLKKYPCYGFRGKRWVNSKNGVSPLIPHTSTLLELIDPRGNWQARALHGITGAARAQQGLHSGGKTTICRRRLIKGSTAASTGSRGGGDRSMASIERERDGRFGRCVRRDRKLRRSGPDGRRWHACMDRRRSETMFRITHRWYGTLGLFHDEWVPVKRFDYSIKMMLLARRTRYLHGYIDHVIILAFQTWNMHSKKSRRQWHKDCI